MKHYILTFAFITLSATFYAQSLQEKIMELPVFDELASTKTPYDWLLTPERSSAGIYRSTDGSSVIVANGMVWRTLRVTPNLATTDYVNRMTGERMLRAVGSEGTITIDSTLYQIGGLQGQEERGYLLDEWIPRMEAIPGAFKVEDIEVRSVRERFPWKRVRWALVNEMPTGKEVVFTLRGVGDAEKITLRMIYSVYDRIPVIQKRFELSNGTDRTVCVDAFELERMSFFELESPVDTPSDGFLLPNVHIECDYEMGGSFTARETNQAVRWEKEPEYTSQRNYGLKTPCRLVVAPRVGPSQELKAGGTFHSFSVFEMPFDSFDRERKGLFTRRFTATLAPWTTQNPIFLHLTSTNPDVVRRAVDQCAETGYEMIILSFGSGLNMEDITEGNIQRFKSLVDYAHSRGIEMGCYSLLASRSVDDSTDCINPTTGKSGGMKFGNSPCLCSQWGEEYFQKLTTFLQRTGMTCLEHDGSYPGDVCASTSHPGHKGLADSQWNQFNRIADFYHWMCSQGIYINVPDYYLLNGSTKVGIGYRETNWSLPRERQIIHARQVNYDGTWERPVGALWSFTPLVQYHGGGEAATLEPLSQHLTEYRTHMMQNYGAGVQACYRGPRLYDNDTTKKAVTEIITWYKKYRTILNSDIIHLRKPDARDWDGFLHVNPHENTRGLAMLFNPLNEDITRTITLPLYYTGLSHRASIRQEEGKVRRYSLDANHSVTITVRIPARGYTWFVIEP